VKPTTFAVGVLAGRQWTVFFRLVSAPFAVLAIAIRNAAAV